jgi:hypothetical protein
MSDNSSGMQVISDDTREAAYSWVPVFVSHAALYPQEAALLRCGCCGSAATQERMYPHGDSQMRSASGTKQVPWRDIR